MLCRRDHRSAVIAREGGRSSKDRKTHCVYELDAPPSRGMTEKNRSKE